MTEVVSKCGMNCAMCPWSPITRKKIPEEELPEFRKRAKAILGYTPTEKPCLLCLTPEEKIPKDVKHWHANFRRGCRIRQCVTQMGIKNCAYCSRFPCASEKTHAGTWTRESLEKRLDRPITDEEYKTFIEPFEGIKRLERIRSTLKPDEIVEAITVDPLKVKVVDFPDTLSSPQAEALKTVYVLLRDLKQSSLGLADTDLLPGKERLKRRIKHLFRFLWIFASLGNLKDKNEGYLIVDAKTFLDNRGSETGLGTWDILDQIVFLALQKFGIQSELVELEKEWKTPMGALRKDHWEIRLSFDQKIGGLGGLKAFHDFGIKLDEKYGKKAFRYFTVVDMRIFTAS